jgi:hypothetical protein
VDFTAVEKEMPDSPRYFISIDQLTSRRRTVLATCGTEERGSPCSRKPAGIRGEDRCRAVPVGTDGSRRLSEPGLLVQARGREAQVPERLGLQIGKGRECPQRVSAHALVDPFSGIF